MTTYTEQQRFEKIEADLAIKEIEIANAELQQHYITSTAKPNICEVDYELMDTVAVVLNEDDADNSGFIFMIVLVSVVLMCV